MGVKMKILGLITGSLLLCIVCACGSTAGTIPAGTQTNGGHSINANIASFCEGASYFTAKNFTPTSCKSLVDSAYDSGKDKFAQWCQNNYAPYLGALCAFSASPCYDSCDALYDGIMNNTCTSKCVSA